MKDLIVRRLLRVKWGLAVMAVFSLFLSFYVYVTPAQGGTGMFMITPTNGLEGTIEQLPWFLIVFGALAFIGSVVSKSTWVLGFVEPVMALIMFVVGFWELFFPYDFTVVSQTWAVVGVFLSFYVMFIALEIDRKRAGVWSAVLVLAAAIFIVSFVNLFNFAGDAGTQALSALELFLAGLGFLYGAVRLTGVAPARRARRERWVKDLVGTAA